jgi:Methyltransferase domain
VPLDGLPELKSCPSSATNASYYDEFYYRHCCGRPYRRDDLWLAFFDRIAERIVTTMDPRTVLDAGCAHGLLVEGLRQRGVAADGVDISSFAMDQVHQSVRAFCWRGDVTEALGQRYDLIVSIEVLEHLSADDGERAIANFCAHADDVLFSSTPWDFKEPTHVTVRGPEHWSELFAVHGFHRDLDFDASFITPWAARFRKASDLPSRLVRHYERRQWALQREAHDARQYALEVHQRFTALERELDGERSALAELKENEVALKTSLAAAQADCKQLALRLSAALDCISAMERSVFWRLRRWIRG